MTLGITPDSAIAAGIYLSDPLNAWVAANGLENTTKLIALDESLTRWTITESVVDAQGRLVLTDDKSEIATRERMITTTPCPAEWLSEVAA